MTLNWATGHTLIFCFYSFTKKIMTEFSYEPHVFGMKLIQKFDLISECIWFKMSKIEIFIAKHFIVEVGLVAHHQHLSIINGLFTRSASNEYQYQGGNVLQPAMVRILPRPNLFFFFKGKIVFFQLKVIETTFHFYFIIIFKISLL